MNKPGVSFAGLPPEQWLTCCYLNFNQSHGERGTPASAFVNPTSKTMKEIPHKNTATLLSGCWSVWRDGGGGKLRGLSGCSVLAELGGFRLQQRQLHHIADCQWVNMPFRPQWLPYFSWYFTTFAGGKKTQKTKYCHYLIVHIFPLTIRATLRDRSLG